MTGFSRCDISKISVTKYGNIRQNRCDKFSHMSIRVMPRIRFMLPMPRCDR
jgi:hypothetical protein